MYGASFGAIGGFVAGTYGVKSVGIIAMGSTVYLPPAAVGVILALLCGMVGSWATNGL